MRFYSGFSFKLKWRYLKWLAIPLFAILSYFIGAFGYINVNAVYNANTSYNITLPNYNDYLYNSNCGSENAHALVQSLINESSSLDSYITIIPNINNNSLTLYASKKSTTNVNRYYYYLNTGGGQFFGLMSNTNGYNNISSLTIDFNSCSSFTNSIAYNTWYNFAKNSVSYSNEIQETGFTLTYLTSNKLTASSSDLSSISNDNSYTINNAYYPYYSSRTMNFKANSDETKNYAYYYFKKICLTDNNTCYAYLDNLVSYYDIYGAGTPPSPSISTSYSIGSKNSLGTIYTNFEPSFINHYDLDISFNTNINYISGYDYYQNIDFTNINCYGRINHNDNYYSYEKFSSCTFELNTDNLNVSSSNDIVDFTIENLEIFNSNDIKITDFSNYDKIFMYLDFQYEDNTLNTYVSNLQFNSSMDMLYLDNLKGEIFDDFDLPSYFKLFISNTGFSNDMSSNVSVRSRNSFLLSNNFLYSQPYSTSTLEPTQVYGFISSNFQNLYVNNSQNLGYMIYHQINNLNLNISPHLDMILMRDIIVSFRNISSNDFYYADDTGTITNNNIDLDYSYGVEESFADITGLLPPGPLDSLLNIPFKYLSKTINSLNQACSPLSIPFVFDSELTFPCFDTYYEEFPSSLKIFTEVVPCAFILIFYFKYLYKKISRATTLETTDNDEWGCL